MKYLSLEEVVNNGIEFAGSVCYSGEFGQQVFTKEMEEGGIPIEGILYERYANGKLNYYSFYSNGIPNGQEVTFYENGKIKSSCIMDNGTIDGEYIEFYENGKVRKKEFCKYGLILKMHEFDEKGNIIKEKKNLDKDEERILKNRMKYYEQ